MAQILTFYFDDAVAITIEIGFSEFTAQQLVRSLWEGSALPPDKSDSTADENPLCVMTDEEICSIARSQKISIKKIILLIQRLTKKQPLHLYAATGYTWSPPAH